MKRPTPTLTKRERLRRAMTPHVAALARDAHRTDISLSEDSPSLWAYVDDLIDIVLGTLEEDD